MRSIKTIIKILLLLGVSGALVSCGDDNSGSSIGLEKKTIGDVSISIPQSWPLVSKDSEGIPKPSSGDIVLIASSQESRNNVANNVVVLKNPISKDTSDSQYFRSIWIGTAGGFDSYRETDSGDIAFFDDAVSKYSVFRARYNENTPLLQYFQTARVCNGNGYVITMTVDPEIEDMTRYKRLASTFECQKS